MTTKRTTLLFVDDDVAFLEVIQELMSSLSGGSWEILVAPNAARALALIRDRQIDLLVLDVHMPVMDGLQFLTLLHRRYPHILKVTLTSDATEQYRAACLSNGAELFLEKAADYAGWQSIHSALNELLRFKPEEGFRGVLRRVGLHDVLQMECLARSSSVLEVTTGRAAVGSIFIKDGQMIHAQAGDLAGEEALNHLISLGGGQFNLRPFVEPPSLTLNGPWEFLLMEAARKRDEMSESQMAHRVMDSSPGAAAEELAASLPAVPAELRPPTSGSPGPKIDELLICSTQGDVLYEWQCAEAQARIHFLQFLSERSWQLQQGLPIGLFERLEIEGTQDRIVTLILPDRALFLRASRVPGDASKSTEVG